MRGFRLWSGQDSPSNRPPSADVLGPDQVESLSVWSLAAIWVALVLIFLLSTNYVSTGDTEPAELLPIAVLRNASLSFDGLVDRQHLPYGYRIVGSKIVSAYPIVAGIVNVIPFAAANVLRVDLDTHRPLLSHITAASLTAMSAVLLFMALERLGLRRRSALLWCLIYAFGTCVWTAASRSLGQHSPSLCFLALTLLLVLRTDFWSNAALGAAAAVAVLSRPTDALLVAPLLILGIGTGRRAFWRTATFVAPFALMGWYSAANLGSFWRMGQLYREGGFAGFDLGRFAGLLVSPSRGMFLFSPILLFAGWGAILGFRRFRSMLFVLLPLSAIFVIALYSCWGMWWGGASFGYRLIVDVVPWLIFCAAMWSSKSHTVAATSCIAIASLLSVLVQVVGIRAYPNDFDRNLDLEPHRLWNFRHSELADGVRKMFGVVGSAELLPPVPAIWWSPTLDDESIPGWLDAVPGAEPVDGPLRLSGWAQERTGFVDVRIVLDDGRVISPDRFPRPDVRAVIPELHDIERAGFRAVIPNVALGPQPHAFTIEMKSSSGRVRRLGPTKFRW